MVQVSDCSHKSLKGHEAPVLTVALDPDEEFLVTNFFACFYNFSISTGKLTENQVQTKFFMKANLFSHLQSFK